MSVSEVAGLALPGPRERRRAIIASVIGNGLEWFDFLTYGFFAAAIGATFFPTGDATASLLLSFGTFAVGFFVRPFGGILIGFYADRVGRRPAMILLILMMALGTLIIALTPGYATIGIAAPVIVVLGRIIQGASVGGEFASATAMLVEYAPPGRRIFYGSFQLCAQALASVLCALAVIIVSTAFAPPQVAAWGWRIPFVLGALIGPIGFYIRARVAESPEFERYRHEAAPVEQVGVATYMSRHGAVVCAAAGVIIVGTVLTYIWSLYLPAYLQRSYGLSPVVGLVGICITGTLNMVLYPLSATLADRVGPFKLIVPAIVAIVLLAHPLLAYVSAAPTPLHVWEVQVVVVSLVGIFIGGPFSGTLAILFPVGVRSAGVSLCYNIVVTIFGGLAPVIITSLINATGDTMVPAYYMIATGVLALALILPSLPRIRRAVAEAVA